MKPWLTLWMITFSRTEWRFLKPQGFKGVDQIQHWHLVDYLCYVCYERTVWFYLLKYLSSLEAVCHHIACVALCKSRQEADKWFRFCSRDEGAEEAVISHLRTTEETPLCVKTFNLHTMPWPTLHSDPVSFQVWILKEIIVFLYLCTFSSIF